VRTSPSSSPTNKRRGNVNLSNRIVKPINRSALKKSSPSRVKNFSYREYEKDQELKWKEKLIALAARMSEQDEAQLFSREEFSPPSATNGVDHVGSETSEEPEELSCSTNKVDSAIKLTLSPTESQNSDAHSPSLDEQGSVTPSKLLGNVMALNNGEDLNTISGASWKQSQQTSPSPASFETKQRKNFHQYWLAKTEALQKLQWNIDNSAKASSAGSPTGKKKRRTPKPWENPLDNAVPSVVASSKPVKRVSSFGTEQRVNKLRRKVSDAPQPWENPHENAIPSVVASVNPVKRVSSFGAKQNVLKLRRREYGAPQPWENPLDNAIPSVVASVNPVKRVSSFGTTQTASKLRKRQAGAPQPWENPLDNAIPSVVASVNPVKRVSSFGTKQTAMKLRKREVGAPQPWENPLDNAIPSVVASVNPVKRVSSFGTKQTAMKLRKREAGAPQPWENPLDNAIPSVVASVNPVKRVSSFGTQQRAAKLVKRKPGAPQPWEYPLDNAIPSISASAKPGSKAEKIKLPGLKRRSAGSPQPWENPHENAVPAVVSSTNNVNWTSSFGNKPRTSKSLRKRQPGAPQPWENPLDNAVPSVVASVNPVHRTASFGSQSRVGKLRPTFGSSRPWQNPHENTIPAVASLGSVQSVSKIREGRERPTLRSLQRPWRGTLSANTFGSNSSVSSKGMDISSFGVSPIASSPRGSGHIRRFSAGCRLDSQAGAADFAELCLLRSRLRSSSTEKAGLISQIGALREELKAANDRIYELDVIVQNDNGNKNEKDDDAGKKLRGMEEKLKVRDIEADRLRKEVETLKVELLNALSLNRGSFRDHGGQDVAYLQIKNQLSASNAEKAWLRNQFIEVKRDLNKANKKNSELTVKLAKTKKDITARMKSKIRGLEVKNTSLQKRLKAEVEAKKLLQEQLPGDKEVYLKTIQGLEEKWNEVNKRNKEVAEKMAEQERKLKEMKSIISLRDKEHALRDEELQLKAEKVAMLEDVLSSMKDIIVPRELNMFHSSPRKSPHKSYQKFRSRSFSKVP